MTESNGEFVPECDAWMIYNPYDAWPQYEETLEQLQKKGGARHGKGAYLPSPLEIRERELWQQTLRDLGVCDRVQNAVMTNECPHFFKFMQMVEKYGVIAAEKRILRFIRE
jgi:hypothetical protein